MKKFAALVISLTLIIVTLSSCIQDNRQAPGDGGSNDTTSPQVVATSPVNLAANIPLNTAIVISFNESIDPMSVDSSTYFITYGANTVAATHTVTDSVCTLSPSSNLLPGTEYTVSATTGITDEAGNPLAANYSWKFTTGSDTDTVSPTVLSSSPGNNATGISLNATVSIVFSESVLASSVNSSTIQVKRGSSTLTGSLGINDNIITFTPSSAYAANETHQVTIATGVKDLAGNGLASAVIINFTTGNSGGTVTDTVPPQITSTTPSNGAAGVSINSTITVVFNEQMNSATVNTSSFRVTGSSSVSGAVVCNGLVATFTPTAPLAYSTTYTVTISTAVTDIAGNPMQSDYTSSFTTKGPEPEIRLFQGATEIQKGGSLNFGSVTLGNSVPAGIKITNAGLADLLLTGNPIVTVTGADASSFQINQPTDTTIAASGETSFTITFNPATTGTKTATIGIANNDADEASFSFTVSGTSVYNVGKIWTQATASATWKARVCHATVVFNDQIWVIGGAESYGGYELNDVWYSSDGNNWTQAVGSASWSKRRSHTCVVFANKIWIIGGYRDDTSSSFNDVWNSSDGINWTRVTATAGWTARYYHASVVFDDKIWVLGGYNGVNMNDVWCSTDGISWTQMSSSAEWSRRAQFSSVVFNNKIWVIGGSYSGEASAVWSSSDGINWTQVVADTSWLKRSSHTSLIFDNKIWLIGGWIGGDGSKNDVWHSTDGINWSQSAANAGWTARVSHTSASFHGKMWVIGGANGSSWSALPKNDVWYAQ